MKSFIVFILLLSGCAMNPQNAETVGEEMTWVTLHTIDTAQTANIRHTLGVHEEESAFIIGREPKRASVYEYMGALTVLHIGATAFMAAHHWPAWMQHTFESLTISDAASCVRANYSVGLTAHF